MRKLWMFLLLTALTATAQQPALMPWPSKIALEMGRLRFTAPIQAKVMGPASERITAGLARWGQRLAEKAGPGSFGESRNGTALTLRFGAVADLQDKSVDGSYSMVTDENGISVEAATDIGALHALATVYQCLQRGPDGWEFPALHIADKPRFPWRGLLIDPCRHWMPLDVVLRELDGMELVKMNVLHLHLTDDQGFRIESKVFPELHEKGGLGQYYSQADIRKIIHEADLRGIRVVPEFDLPGHATSWFLGHPELASAPGPYKAETRYGVMDPVFDPSKEATYALLDRFLGEMATIFPDPYMHIGGDENNGKQWDANTAIQAFMKKNGLPDDHALQAYFNQRVHAILAKQGKRMMGWDEIGDVPAGSAHALPQDVAIQCWRGKQGLITALKAGHDAILSNGWYIDLCQSAAFHYLNDSLPKEKELSAAERNHLLGGEATMWSELVDARNVDTRIWPRTAAIAERLWSPEAVADVADMYRRLEAVSGQLEALGLRHKTAQEELLRMIAGNDHIDALKQLVDVLEPVPEYERHKLAVHNTSTPLTGLADAAVPDPARARQYADLIDRMIQNRTALEASNLRSFSGAGEADLGIPGLKDVANARARLEQSAQLVADEWSRGARPAPQSCSALKLALDVAERPFHECRFANLDAFKRLYAAACRATP
jgi:hexosaminidase